ncbi:MAG: GNAT family N-acetyltransferase [Planctomycetota bacterium]|nr:GNAT family N-acetyltransferase [Planctomycetota bacterium]
MSDLIRPVEPADIPMILRMTARTAMFKPLEVEALQEVLDDYFAVTMDMGHKASVLVEEGIITGYAYWAPAAMTDRTWYLYWIAISNEVQGKGRGGRLLRHAEDDSRSEGARIFLIETSGTSQYERTRQFYLKYDYNLCACVPDYYADGDDLCIFEKRLAPKA